MEAFRPNPNMNPAQDSDEPALSMVDLCRNIKSKWYWYVISFAVVFVAVLFYLLCATPLYTRTAQILLKDDASQSMTTDLESLGVKSVNSNILDEMFILGSPAVMETVVSRLGLNRVYSVRKGLRQNELYRNSPVETEVLDSISSKRPYKLSLAVCINGDSTVTLSDFCFDKEVFADDVTGRLGDTLSTPIGRVAVYATRFMSDDYEGEKIRYSQLDVRRCAQQYCEKLKTEYDEDLGSIITMSIACTSTDKADDVLNAVVESYNERWISDRNKVAMSTSRFIEDRLRNIESELNTVESNITDYQSRHAIVDMDAVSSMYLSQSNENRKALNDLAQEIATATYVKNELAGNDITKLLPATAEIAGTNLQSLITSYNDMVTDRNLRLRSMPESSPIIARKTEAITQSRMAILESVDNALATLNARFSSLELIDAKTQHKLTNAPGQNHYLMSEDRKQKVKESLYVYLLQRREENELSQAFTAYNTRMVTEPYGLSVPTSPNKRNVLMVAFALALLVPTVVIYVMEITNTKVRSRRDLETLSVPYVGEIPRNKKALQTSRLHRRHNEAVARDIVVRPKCGDLINEAFRMVRTNIEFMNALQNKGQGRVMMVVSLNAGSGKTFVALNMAATLAVKSERVCLVDLDLRKGTVSQSVGDPLRGVTDYLVGNAELDDVIVRDVDGIRGFDILPEGTRPPNPTELLFNPRLAEMFDKLQAKYDYVVVDCPPVECVGDAKVINKFVNMTLFVVRAGLAERSQLADIQSFYDEGRYNNMALILNATTELHGVYGRYGYGHGYVYGKKRDR